MNLELLKPEVQSFIRSKEITNVEQIALSKSPFPGVSSAELANQIKSRKKAAQKIPSWYNTENIIYPPYLSMEQCSSEDTAKLKAKLIQGNKIIDITGGYGVDSLFFAKSGKKTISIERQKALCDITIHNAQALDLQDNIQIYNADGIDYLSIHSETYDAIYVDPARRAEGRKVYQLADCEPAINTHLNLLFARTNNIWIKTAPFLDINAGLKELENTKGIHIISIKNECKELLWNLEKNYSDSIQIICHCIGPKQIKTLHIPLEKLKIKILYFPYRQDAFLYEPDAGLLKSGAFNFIAEHYNLKKIHPESHIYWSLELNTTFPGRIFEVDSILNPKDLKKENLSGNVIVRNYPDRAENLVKKYKIKSHKEQFLIFTQDIQERLIFKAKIVQHY
ncbi:MAG: hypothetical protein EOO99_08190 [Pedobacter sp.]|nr:MAG: hypothetical protein EOO99_08190 [Pedobacter sp.]